jgi:hypothetical protein
MRPVQRRDSDWNRRNLSEDLTSGTSLGEKNEDHSSLPLVPFQGLVREGKDSKLRLGLFSLPENLKEKLPLRGNQNFEARVALGKALAVLALSKGDPEGFSRYLVYLTCDYSDWIRFHGNHKQEAVLTALDQYQFILDLSKAISAPFLLEIVNRELEGAKEKLLALHADDARPGI